jgi:hypothetical protein
LAAKIRSCNNIDIIGFLFHGFPVFIPSAS